MQAFLDYRQYNNKEKGEESIPFQFLLGLSHFFGSGAAKCYENLGVS